MQHATAKQAQDPQHGVDTVARASRLTDFVATCSSRLAPLDAALAVGDLPAAVKLAFDSATEAVALMSQGTPAPGSGRAHAVLLELTPIPLAALDDGTLSEQTAYVTLTYRGWDVAEEQAAELLRTWCFGAVDSP